MNENDPSWADFIAAWPIFREAVLCGLIAGGILGMLGVQVVLRRAVFVSAVLSQVAGLGVAMALWVGMLMDTKVEPMVGAVGFCVLATTVLGARPERWGLSREVLLALVWVGAGAASLVVGDKIAAEAHDIQAILFGSAVLVRSVDLWLVGGVGAICGLAQVLAGQVWIFSGFDADVARIHGLPVRGLDMLLWACVAGMVSVATRALGALPVFAFTVLPAMAALLLSRGMRGVVVMAGVIGALAGAGGYLLAFFEAWPVGASQTLVAVLVVLMAGAIHRIR